MTELIHEGQSGFIKGRQTQDFIEPLAQAVRQNEDIEGVNMRDTQHKIGLMTS